MRSPRSSFTATCAGLLLVACSTDPSDPPSLECTSTSVEVLVPGQHRVLNPIQDDACVRLPQAAAAGAQHLYVPVGTEGRETTDGVSAPYALTGSAVDTAAPPALLSARLSAFQSSQSAAAFHRMLRERERALSESPSAALFERSRIASSAAVPPVQGEQRTFNVCTSRRCDEFTQVTSTAKIVGERVAIFEDNAAPGGGYDDTDLANVGALFDDWLYPIDTTAFGRESDVDGNGVVIVLLTHKVNALSPTCTATGSVILGYFFGADLLPRSTVNPGSNRAEIFFGLVPDPGNLSCTVSEDFARTRLPATFIHEFQHMISFNQHVLVRGTVSEDTWLNEGLSHFAEELGARLIPDTACPLTGSCWSDFVSGTLENGLEYLRSPEDYFLIEPGTSSGELAERGANWLFVRWAIDHFAADSVLGADFTRKLVATRLVGAANIQAQTGTAFSTLVPEWQMTNYLDDLPGFSQTSGRLRYKMWNFRSAADSLGHLFLTPDDTPGPGYTHSGVLRAGSGRHVLVTQPADGAPVDLRLTDPSGTAPVSTAVDPRIGLVRIR